MIGRRVTHDDFWAAWGTERAQLGDYALAEEPTSEGFLGLAMVLPNGVIARLLVTTGETTTTSQGGPVWHFHEEEDGSLTVTPSINQHPAGDKPGWHGFLTRGEWITA